MKCRNLVKLQLSDLELIDSENEMVEVRGGKSIYSLLQASLQGGIPDHNDNCNCHCETEAEEYDR